MERLIFEDCVLDLDRFELRRAGQVHHLEPQVFGVLAHLARNSHRLVTKEELLDVVWGDRFVSESALTSRIRAARAAVGDDGRAQRIIRTVHGRGYAWACPVEPETPATRSSGTDPAPPAFDSPRGGLVLERETELATICELISGLHESGRGGVVCLSGAAGLGKTTLVRTVIASVSGPVLLGSCEDLTAPRPLGPFRDMVLPGGAPLLGRDVGAPDPSDTIDALTAVSAADCPPVVLVEDAHWADDATVDLLRILVRHSATIPALVVLTYRDDDIPTGHPMRRLLGSLRPPVTHLRLRPLSLAAVGELVTGTNLDAERVLDVTGGNPFFVSEIVANPEQDVPITVRDAVLARLDASRPEVRTALHVLSVVPSRVERSLAGALTDGAETVLNDAERSGLLDGDAGAVWFRHELARRAIEVHLTAGERLAHNAAVARTLVALDGDPARIVHHALACGDEGLIADHGLAAGGRAAAAGAHRQAVAHLDAFLAAVGDADARRAAEAQVLRSHSLYLLNRFAESLDAARDAVSAWSTLGDDESLARALAGLARTSLWAVGPRAAEAAASDALAAAERARAPHELRTTIHAELARALGNLATLGPVSEPSGPAIEHARTAVELAEVTGRADALSHALTYLGAERLSNGDSEGAADLERAIALARDDSRVEFVGRSCVNASGAQYRRGATDEALRLVELGLDACADGEFFAGEYRLRLTRAAVLASTGRWAPAERELRELVDLPGEPGIMRPMALALLVRLRARQGGSDAEEIERAALDAVAGSEEPHAVGPVAIAVAERRWLAGEPQPSDVLDALSLVRHRGHGVSEAELASYLQRAGVDVGTLSSDLPAPWSLALAGNHADAAAGWRAHREEYEQAVEMWLAGDRTGATDRLHGLGAGATVEALRRG